MSKIDDIKDRKRKDSSITPTGALSEPIQNKNRRKEGNTERKRVSFDIRVDLHKKLKMESAVQDKNIYVLIEEALEKHFQ